MLIKHRMLLPLVLLFAVIVSFSVSTTVSACPDYGRFSKAYTHNNLSELRKMVNNLGDCSEINRDKYRYLVARKLYDAAVSGKTEATIRQQDFAEVMAVYPTLWAVMADLGDLSMRAKNYKAGLDYYEEAIMDIKGVAQGEILEIKQDKDAISNEYILTLKDKADNARLLASLSGEYIAPVRTRGKLDGMHGVAIRRVAVTLNKYPIRFDYDHHRLALDTDNTKNVELLAEVLANAEDPDIEVIGHTDYKGSHDYNDTLSLRRANILRDYLMDEGYQGKIITIGRGEREPIKMHSAQRKHLTDKEWRQLNRRVETRRIKK
jgi:outer membrane protein OmpA-like peptidoglycan-associated protein